MMRDILAFQIGAPLSSWGSVAVGERRPTDLRPTHSALIGMLGAALGYGRSDPRLNQLTTAVSFSTRCDRTPTVMTDFHTVQTAAGKLFATRADQLAADNIRTVLSRRQYLMDALFTVIALVGANSPATAEEIAAALREPRWPLYVGRKSCVLSLPPHPLLIEADSLDAVYEAYDRQRPAQQRVDATREIAIDGAFVAAGLVDANRIYRTDTRRDVPTSRGYWRHELRNEHILKSEVAA